MNRPPSASSASPAKVILGILLAALLPALATAFFHPRHPDWSRRAVRGIDADDAQRSPRPPLWIDARPNSTQVREKMSGAIALGSDRPWEQALAEIAGAWAPPQPIIVYCEDERCPASREVADRLRQELGATEIFFLRGGWAAWRQRNQ